MPKTRTLFALRAAVVRGTFVHASANGAAAALAPFVARFAAVAVAATATTAPAATAAIKSRLCIVSPLVRAPEPDRPTPTAQCGRAYRCPTHGVRAELGSYDV